MLSLSIKLFFLQLLLFWLRKPPLVAKLPFWSASISANISSSIIYPHPHTQIGPLFFLQNMAFFISCGIPVNDNIRFITSVVVPKYLLPWRPGKDRNFNFVAFEQSLLASSIAQTLGCWTRTEECKPAQSSGNVFPFFGWFVFYSEANFYISLWTFELCFSLLLSMCIFIFVCFLIASWNCK